MSVTTLDLRIASIYSDPRASLLSTSVAAGVTVSAVRSALKRLKVQSKPCGRITRNADARFWAKVDKASSAHGCWLWLGATALKRSGHGLFNRGEKTVYAHRFAYELVVGPIPPGLTLDHFRMNPGPRHAPCSTSCVNPAHLEPVTSSDNTLRGKSLAAKNARKTHCKRGHAFTPGNTRPRLKLGRPGRNCRTCDAYFNSLRAR